MNDMIRLCYLHIRKLCIIDRCGGHMIKHPFQ